MLGDSHAEGYSVDFQDLFSEALKRRLNKNGEKRYEVINAGTSAYSTDQELLFFQNEGKKYQPDLTILVFSANNVWFNNQTSMGRWQKPVFNLAAGELHLTHVPVPASKDPYNYKMRQFLKKSSYCCRFMYKAMIYSRPYFWLSQWGLTPFPERSRVWQRNYTPSLRDSWHLTEALLAKLKREVELSGSDFFVFYVPLPPTVYPEAWEETREQYAMSDAEWDPLQDSRELATICSRCRIDLLNPVQRFREIAIQRKGIGKKLYQFRDDHWTRDGHQVAGEILLEYLTKNYIAAVPHRPSP